MRKVNLLMLANYYAPVSRHEYLSKAHSIFAYIIKMLQSDPNHHYSRILALLMQNSGVFEYLTHLPVQPTFGPVKSYKRQPPQTRFTAFKNLSIAIYKASQNFSLKKELHWVARRSSKLARVIGFHP
jgi:hypothetical protein